MTHALYAMLLPFVVQPTTGGTNCHFAIGEDFNIGPGTVQSVTLPGLRWWSQPGSMVGVTLTDIDNVPIAWACGVYDGQAVTVQFVDADVPRRFKVHAQTITGVYAWASADHHPASEPGTYVNWSNTCGMDGAMAVTIRMGGGR